MELLKRKTKFGFSILVGLTALVVLCGVFESFRPGLAANTDLKIKRTVIIDPGHGGFDGGAVAPDGTLEKDINLKVALKLQKALQSLGIQVVMTRDTDKALGSVGGSVATNKQADLKHRADVMKQYPGALFLSIHENKFEQENQWGLQTFYTAGDENAKILGEAIQSSVVTNLQPNNKRLSKADNRKVYILKNAVIPAVIVECGFLSNSEDLKNLKSDSYVGKLSLCIADGILNYYNVTER